MTSEIRSRIMSRVARIIRSEDFLSRIMTANPYTAEGKRILDGLKVDDGLDFSMTIEDFYDPLKGLYVIPFFDKSEGSIVDYDVSNAEFTSVENDKDDYNFENFNFQDNRKQSFVSNLLREKIYFENAIKSKAEFVVLFIRGMTGSGKSTYLHKLVHDLVQAREYIHVPYYLDEYENRPLFYGEKLPLCGEHPNSATFSFLNLVCDHLIDEIKNILKCDKSVIDNILKNYGNSFEYCTSHRDESRAFFKLFASCNGNAKKEDVLEKGKEFSKAMLGLLDLSDIRESISEILLCLCKLLYLRQSNKRFLLTFDGVEYLIKLKNKPTKHIYDADVESIMLAVLDFENKANAIFQECESSFAQHFKVVICARDTTTRYFKDANLKIRMLQENVRDMNASVNITEWYKINRIYKARLKYYQKINGVNIFIEQYRPVVDTIMHDIETSKHRRANQIVPMIERMYNYDKRSIQRNLFEVVSQMLINSPSVATRFIEFYNDKGPLTYGGEGFRYRFLCRRVILRLLLNRIEREDNGEFFNEIYVSRLGIEAIPSTFARKLLIYLMYKLVKNNKIEDEYVDIRELIDNVARPRSGNFVNATVVDVIARLMYFMSDYRLHNSAWQQLISVKFNYKEISNIPNDEIEAFFVGTIRKIYKDQEFYNNHKGHFGVRITYAGTFLAYMQSDYAFCACRHENSGGGSPLILSNDPRYICDVIQSVYSNAVKCIKAVIENEKDLFGKYGEMYQNNGKSANYLYPDFVTGRFIPHPKRILDNHIMYLEHYRTFASTVDNVFKSEDDRNTVIVCIKKYLDAYKRRHNELYDGYGYIENDVNILSFSGNTNLKDNEPNPRPYFSYFPWIQRYDIE